MYNETAGTAYDNYHRGPDVDNVTLNITYQDIPPIDEDPTFHFAKLKFLANENDIHELSIGMSNDYEKALQFNPTYIRLGTILFGNRL